MLALRNDYRHDLLNGTRATVTAIDERSQRLEAKTAAGQSIEIPFAYAEDCNLTHAYATTIHKAQGATADRALILADETMAREHLYTALSRGRSRNDLYLATSDLADEFTHPSPARRPRRSPRPQPRALVGPRAGYRPSDTGALSDPLGGCS